MEIIGWGLSEQARLPDVKISDDFIYKRTAFNSGNSCRERLYMDLLGPYPRKTFPLIQPLWQFATRPICDYLKSQNFKIFGVPETIVNVNRSQLKWHQCKDFFNF